MKGIFKRDINDITHTSNFIINILIGIFALLCFLPFVFVVMISITDEHTLAVEGYRFFPSKFSNSAYYYIFKTGIQLLKSYGVTILVTVVGTIITVFITALYAYAISRPEFRYRKFFNFFSFFTMLFSGGLVPFYIVCTKMLYLTNTIWALILPLAGNAFYIVILRTFFKTSIHDALIEAARIDGANEFVIFFKIVVPLSLPGLATIGLFSAIAYWNDWFNALLFIENPDLTPLQYLLMRIQIDMEFLVNNAFTLSAGETIDTIRNMPLEASRMAMVILVTGPIILAYPFFQKYFIQGLTIGSIKE
ncbi:MAG: carbohydrate ABC transporter permease [Spirochaetes bacterium]|nr:carbohydrate ABC transporter permease [Spirochaetota bacterium]